MCRKNSDVRTMRRIPSVALAVMASALMAASCSVKEDRASCPCLLVLDFSEADKMPDGPVALYVAADGDPFLSDVLPLNEYRGRDYITPVPRTGLDMVLWYGGDGSVSESGLEIPLGEDCPEVYIHASVFAASGERHDEVVNFHKNHCRMTLYAAGDVGVPLSMTVYGNVAGYGRNGKPVEGPFEYCIDYADLKEGHDVVLPRQVDTSLKLIINDPDDDVKVFALGHYLESCGYDWSDADLEDVTVTIDFASTEVRLSVKGWEGVYTYQIDF